MTRLSTAHRRLRRVRSDESGFTVVEVAVAIALVTIVMTSLAAYFVNSSKVTENQGRRQAAVHVALSAMDKARSLTGIGLTTDRDKSSSDTLWSRGQDTTAATKFPGVAPYLTNVAEAYDTTSGLAANTGYTAALPTNGVVTTIDSVKYTQNWFLGWCVRQSGAGCAGGTDPNAKYTYVQVVVSVTWPDNGCANNLCYYNTASLVSETQDPVFDQSQGAPKPKVTNPGNQTVQVSQPVALPITMTGGTAPLTWTPPANLPDGLNWGTGSAQCPSSPVCIYGRATTPTTTPIKVIVKVTDAFDYTSSAAFTWTILPGPTIIDPADRTTRTGAADSLTVTLKDGTGPYNWSQTSNLPPGISISSSTTSSVVLSGTPTKGGTYIVQLKVVDKWGATDTETFTWTIPLGGSLQNGNTTGPSNGTYTCSWDVNVYGTAPFTWTADDSRVVITLQNNGSKAYFTLRVPKGTYTVNFSATQTSSGSKLNGWSTCYAGTK